MALQQQTSIHNVLSAATVGVQLLIQLCWTEENMQHNLVTN